MQVQLYKSQSTSHLTAVQQQLFAEATVAVAFQQRSPLLLWKAAGLMRQLEQASARVRMWLAGWLAGSLPAHPHRLL